MAENLAKFCSGCGHPIVLSMFHRILKEKKLEKNTVLGLDIGCSLLAWNYLPVNTFQTHHGRVVPTMVGFRRARSESLSVAYVGDGGAYAIGWQSLFHAALRDESILVIVVNNTIYAMTGGQFAPTALEGQVTPTSPNGFNAPTFLGPEVLSKIVHEKSFLARTAVNDPKQMLNFIEQGIKTQQSGHFALIEFLSFCPTNWRTKGVETLKRLENMRQSFPLGIIK